jgi:hypothetical protein
MIAVIFLAMWFVFVTLAVGVHFMVPNLMKRKPADPPPPPPQPVAFDVRANLVSQANFDRVLGQYAKTRVTPYEYWRAKWEQTGDVEALQQMTRFVDAG